MIQLLDYQLLFENFFDKSHRCRDTKTMGYRERTINSWRAKSDAAEA